MLDALVSAYRALGDPSLLDRALKSARFISGHFLDGKGGLWRKYMDGKLSINGFLDDYAFVIQAFISLYQVVFDEQWLHRAETLLGTALRDFYDPRGGLLFYTSSRDPELIERSPEVVDNVIPSSNSIMARNLLLLGHYFSKPEYLKKSDRMLNRIMPRIREEPGFFAGWGSLLMDRIESPAEVIILGSDWMEAREKLDRFYLPRILLAGGEKTGSLPLLQGREIPRQTTIQVCRNKTCGIPQTDPEQAIREIRSG
jgi:uncharacterized protein YyaL (SSP411 family)